MNRNQKTRRQRHLRRAGHVRRIEFVLGDNDRDEAIGRYLDSLEPGERSEFMRQAVYAAMGQGQLPEAVPDTPASPGDSFNAAMAELDAKIRILQQLAAAIGQQPLRQSLPQTPAQTPPAPPDAPGTAESSGLDLSRPRRRSTRARAPVAPQSTADEPDFDPEASARIFFESARGYGRNHRP